VVVATPIAEASLTLPRVKAVVDGGLRRTPTYDSATGLGTLVSLLLLFFFSI
jgi:ATP-dependent helicase HrpB